jgi:hypothetical protein
MIDLTMMLAPLTVATLAFLIVAAGSSNYAFVVFFGFIAVACSLCMVDDLFLDGRITMKVLKLLGILSRQRH